MTDTAPATVDEARRLLAEHHEQRAKRRKRKRASGRDRAGRLAAAVAGQQSLHRVAVPIPRLDVAGTVAGDQVSGLLAFIVSFEVTIRLRGHRLLIERRGARVPEIAEGTAAANASTIAGLIHRNPCSSCRRPSGRIEATPNPRPDSRPWRISCHRCNRTLRLR